MSCRSWLRKNQRAAKPLRSAIKSHFEGSSSPALVSFSRSSPQSALPVSPCGWRVPLIGANTSELLVIIGCGFTGTVAARLWLEAGGHVIGTTRSPERGGALTKMGVDARVVSRLDAELGLSLIDERTRVLVTDPSEPATDHAILLLLSRARAAVYVSSTGVYGNASGRIDEVTPLDSAEPRAASRIAAENLARAAGAVVLRAAAIYGPGRGLHVRLAPGEHRIAEGGRSVVSWIHVEDLALLRSIAGPRARCLSWPMMPPYPKRKSLRGYAKNLALPCRRKSRANDSRSRSKTVDASMLERFSKFSEYRPEFPNNGRDLRIVSRKGDN